ncbi:hypothetical protein CMV_003920 [Castanea mollissima]|uniref:Uncharacterized protein n=1 Tax=Castanea mollissima TaxID=60419 RepID=A0A8J4VUQ4_9ROSI|nr:hypothetical protein CMV_003920 [Castanea mollissima]
MQNFKSFGFELSIFALGTHGFQPELVAWEHTHGIHILYLYLTLKKQLRIKWPNNKQERAFCNAEVPTWLAISEGEDSMKSIEDLIDIVTELSPSPNYQSPSRNAIDVRHLNLLALYKDCM